MFGIDDISVILAFILCIASTILCLIYGIIQWNKGFEKPKTDDAVWVKHEIEIDDKL
ncbi:MAG TPA: hypothetical protein PLK08_07280 [Phycisphaerae bacterium]|nr:hypothetical protein [Phycisphaerae bacterium]